MKPACTAEVTAPAVLAVSDQSRCRSASMALAANQSEVPPSCASAIAGRMWRGTATVDSLQSGAIYGFAGLVDGLVARLRVELGALDCPVVATGGLAELIASHCTTITRVEPGLTLAGLRLIWLRASAE